MENTLLDYHTVSTRPSGESTIQAPALERNGSAIARPRPVRRQATTTAPVFRPLDHVSNRVFKRVFDLIFSSLVLLIIFPPMLLIVGILIKWESRGPVFFRQPRTGYQNETFRMFKFRSMSVNERSGVDQAVRDDPRVTKVGAFLRRTSLDEFPQFINVWLGQMSVVGPRPHMLKHTDQYSEEIHNYNDRHDVKPGVTGLAQIRGWRGPTEELWKMEGRVRNDLKYINNWSPLLDCYCIFRTVVNCAGEEENAF